MTSNGAHMVPDGYSDIADGKLAAVVTCLQMFAPPGRRAEPTADDWTLVHHARPDVGWYRALYRRIGQDWMWFSRLVMDDGELASIIHDPGVSVHALERGGEALGLLELDFRTEGECELAFFGIDKQLIGAGAGRWLMSRAIELAWEKPIERFWVHTCTHDHPGALGFYIRSGFTPYHRQIEVVDDPRVTGAFPREAAAQIPVIELGGDEGRG